MRLWNLYAKGQLKSNGVVDKDLVEYQKSQQSSGNYNKYKQTKKYSYNAWNDYESNHD